MTDRPCYPLADRDRDGWYADGDYQARGGIIEWMTPAAFLARVRPLTMDETSRDAIDDLKEHIHAGRPLDPLKIDANGREDGRHRAHACMEIGIERVPVLVFGNPATKEIVMTDQVTPSAPPVETPVAKPDVDYSDLGTLRAGIEQAIALIDAAIIMDDEPMAIHIEARMAAIRRTLRASLMVIDSDDHDDDVRPTTPSALKDRERWTFTVTTILGDDVLATGRNAKGVAVGAYLPADLFASIDMHEGLDVVVRLVDSGEFWVTAAADAVPPRNETNPALHRRDPSILARLLAGLRRTSGETRAPDGR